METVRNTGDRYSAFFSEQSSCENIFEVERQSIKTLSLIDEDSEMEREDRLQKLEWLEILEKMRVSSKRDLTTEKLLSKSVVYSRFPGWQLANIEDKDEYSERMKELMQVPCRKSSYDFKSTEKIRVTPENYFLYWKNLLDLYYVETESKVFGNKPDIPPVLGKLLNRLADFLDDDSGQGNIDDKPNDKELELRQAKSYISKQAEIFKKYQDELAKNYSGKYVLFEDGKVLDSGDSHEVISVRAYKKYGMKPLFIKRVDKKSVVHETWSPLPR